MLYALTASFASIDWVLSLQPTFHAAVFGMLAMSGQAVGGYALALLVALGLVEAAGRAELVREHRLVGLGSLFMALVLLWTYFAFIQYLVVWSGDLPHGAEWYLDRGEGVWLGLHRLHRVRQRRPAVRRAAVVAGAPELAGADGARGAGGRGARAREPLAERTRVRRAGAGGLDDRRHDGRGRRDLAQRRTLARRCPGPPAFCALSRRRAVAEARESPSRAERLGYEPVDANIRQGALDRVGLDDLRRSRGACARRAWRACSRCCGRLRQRRRSPAPRSCRPSPASRPTRRSSSIGSVSARISS